MDATVRLAGTLTIQEPRNQEIGEFYEDQNRCATDYEPPKLRKGRS